MDEYMPRLKAVIRDAYRYETGSDGCSVRDDRAYSEFDGWLAGHDAQVKAEALEEIDKHVAQWFASRNLGYYRTEVDCSCGAVLWYGDHDGDPHWIEVWRAHRLKALSEVRGTGAPNGESK